MDRFNCEEKDILQSLGFDITKAEISKEELAEMQSKVEELYTMYGFDDEEQVTILGEIYENILNKIGC